MTNDLTPHTHTIVINIKYSGAEKNNLILTISLKGVISYRPVHKLTKE